MPKTLFSPLRALSWAAAVAIGLAHVPAAAQLKAGDPLPPSLGKTRQGDAVALPDHAGKVVAISFWASWCGPCRLELPLLEKLQRILGPEKLKVIAVNIEERDKFRLATREMGDWQTTLTNDPYKDAFSTYKGGGIPYLLIVSRDGRLRQVFTGYDEQSVTKVVAAVADAVNE